MLDPIVIMVPVRRGRSVPPVKSVISVNPAAVRDTTAARAPAQSFAGASAPVRAAATAPLGVCGCPLRRLLPRCLLHQLELIVSVVVGRNRATGATGAPRALPPPHALYPSPPLLLLLPLLLLVLSSPALPPLLQSAATRSRSSAAVTSASCRCCALEAIER
jgi:hypothetical protein